MLYSTLGKSPISTLSYWLAFLFFCNNSWECTQATSWSQCVEGCWICHRVRKECADSLPDSLCFSLTYLWKKAYFRSLGNSHCPTHLQAKRWALPSEEPSTDIISSKCFESLPTLQPQTLRSWKRNPRLPVWFLTATLDGVATSWSHQRLGGCYRQRPRCAHLLCRRCKSVWQSWSLATSAQTGQLRDNNPSECVSLLSSWDGTLSIRTKSKILQSLRNDQKSFQNFQRLSSNGEFFKTSG